MALPSKATATTAGEIILGGDLAGTADSPQLKASGVTVSACAATKRISIDSKGRVTSIGTLTDTERDTLVDNAYAIDPSRFTIVDGRPVINIPIATTTVAGLVKTDPIVLTPATTNALGVMRVGSGLNQFTQSPTPGVETTFNQTLTINAPVSSRNGALKTTTGYLISVVNGCAVSSDLINWTVVSLGSSNINMWANRGDVVIATQVGSSTAVIRSLNGGLTWSNLTMPSIPSGDRWDTIFTDGTTWIASSTGRGETGNNLVAVSTNDGASWTTANLPNANFAAATLLSFAKVGSTFYASGIETPAGSTSQTRVYSSSNGLTWTSILSETHTGSAFYVNVINNKLVAYGIGTSIRIFENSIWTNYSANLIGSIRFGTFGAATFLNNRIVTFSNDGISWRRRQIPNTGSTPDEVEIRDVLVTSNGVILFTNAKSQTLNSTELLTSYTLAGLGVDFSQMLPSTGGNLNASFGPAQLAFSNVTTPSTITLTARNRENISFNVAPVDEQTVAASSSTSICSLRRTAAGRWISSFYNGTTWTHTRLTTIPPGTSPALIGMAFGNGSFCVIGSNTGGHWYGLTSDGVTWSFGSITFTGTLSGGMVYAYGRFIAPGRNASSQFAFVTSTDGITWTSGSVATTISAPTAIAVGSLHVLVTCGFNGSTGVRTNSIWRTSNGTTWTVNSSSVFTTGQDESLVFSPITGHFYQGGGTSLSATGGSPANRRQIYELRWNASLSRYDGFGVVSHITPSGGASAPATGSTLPIEHISIDSSGTLYWTQGNARFTLTGSFQQPADPHVGAIHPVSTSTEDFIIRGAGANIGKVGISTSSTLVSSFKSTTFGNFASWAAQSIIPIEILVGVSTQDGLLQRVVLRNSQTQPHNLRLTFGNSINPINTFETNVLEPNGIPIALSNSEEKSLVILRLNSTTTLVFEE